MVLVLGTLVMGGAEAQLTSVLEADPRRCRGCSSSSWWSPRARDPLIAARLEALGVRITTIDRAEMPFLPFFASLDPLLPAAPAASRAHLPDRLQRNLGAVGRATGGVRRVMHSDLSLVPTITPLQRAWNRS